MKKLEINWSENFSQEGFDDRFAALSDMERLQLLNEIAAEYHEKINEFQHDIDNLESQVVELEENIDSMKSELPSILSAQEALKIRLGISPVPDQLSFPDLNVRGFSEVSYE